jgi:hypothetical protein
VASRCAPMTRRCSSTSRGHRALSVCGERDPGGSGDVRACVRVARDALSSAGRPICTFKRRSRLGSALRWTLTRSTSRARRTNGWSGSPLVSPTLIPGRRRRGGNHAAAGIARTIERPNAEELRLTQGATLEGGSAQRSAHADARRDSPRGSLSGAAPWEMCPAQRGSRAYWAPPGRSVLRCRRKAQRQGT